MEKISLAKRVRQHVNPLAQNHQVPIAPPDWEQVYQNPNQPLHLDIGCGWGWFLSRMAQQYEERNFLGIEIRSPVIKMAEQERQELGLNNLHYLCGNANTSLPGLLDSLPQGILQWVTIQFPDPWFKTRHQKRRVVQSNLVETLATYLAKDGFVFIQSDVEEVAKQMRDRFQSHPAFHLQHSTPWLEQNPFPVATERERITLEKGQPVYRALFTNFREILNDATQLAH